MQPFKVKFQLSSPIFIDSEYPIHLDALLAYASVQDMEKAGTPDAWESVNHYMTDFLAKTDGEEWVWKASKLFITAASDIVLTNQIRKSDPEMYFDDMHTEANHDGVWVPGFMKNGDARKVNQDTFRINTASGQQRGYQWLSASRWVKDVTAYGIGDIDAIDYYLNQYIQHIGKIGRNGFGRVESIEVTPHDCADDWRLRVLPMSVPGKDGAVYASVQACIRAPYWRKLDRIMAMELVD